MNKYRLKEQVEIIRQAFGYINKFQGKTFVIKIDSELISGQFFPVLIKDLVLLHQMGIRIVIVPGTRSRIDEILKTYNIQCRFVNGIRISPPESIPFIKMAAFDVSNKVMTLLAECGAHAVIGNWVRARSIGVRDGVDFQSSGLVERLQTDILENVLTDGLFPIFPNIGWSGKGKPYNLSSNELACTIAVALKASKLFFLTNRQHISKEHFSVPKGFYFDSSGTISQLTLTDAQWLLEHNQAKNKTELYDLVSLAHKACSDGVKRVHIVDGSVEGMALKEIFSNRGLGTMVYSNQHENIRSITHSDIPELLRLMQPAIEEGILVPRTTAELEEKAEDFYVYEVDGTIHGCGALHTFGDRQGELAAIVVDEIYANLGIGKRIISYLVERASHIKLKAVFVLTTQTSDWFSQIGFVEAAISDLPKERQKTYNKKRNSLILRYELPQHRNKLSGNVE